MEQQAVQHERDEAVQTAPAPPQETESRKKRRRKRCRNKHRPGKRQRELLRAAQARESGHQDGEQGEGATTGVVQPGNETGLLGSGYTTLAHIAEDISWQRTQPMHPQTYGGPDARQQPRSRISNYGEWSGGAGGRWYGRESLEGMAGLGVWHPLPAVPYICYPFVTPYGFAL